MKFGLVPINIGMNQGSHMIGLAQAAEAAGVESVWTFEHAIVPVEYASKYPYNESGKMGAEPETIMVDPLIALTAIAAATKTLRLGTGVNILSQVNPLMMAKQAGGLAGIESELGVGTSAYIYLPLVDQPAVSDDAMPLLTLSAGNGETVLIVEDNPEVLTFMSNSLRQRNYHVIKATDMNSAMDKLADQPEIDVLLTDVALPENKRGEDVAAWILRQRPRTKVIYISGNTRAIVEDDGRLPKGANFLQKPFTVSELERAIRRALDS